MSEAQTNSPMVVIHPLRTEDDHAKALNDIERLWDATDAASVEALEVLSVLIDSYEREHHSIESPDAIQAILFRMEQTGMSRSDLGVILGSRSRATEILSRKRPLTLAMIRRLSSSLGIPAEVLIREAPLRATRNTRRRAPAVASRKRG